MTETTQTARPISQSIHPRAWMPNGKLKNTCAPRSARNGGQGGKRLRKAAQRLKWRINDYERTIASNRAGAGAYARPGSMKA